MKTEKAKVSISARAEKAIKWLDHVIEADGGVHRNLDVVSEAKGPVSTEITGYAAHLFAWLGLVTGEKEFISRAELHADWIVRLWSSQTTFLTFEPGADLTYFFDTGIVARALALCARAAGSSLYEAIARKLAEYMKHFRGPAGSYRPIHDRNGEPHDSESTWWSRSAGPYQLKAALIWRYFGDPAWSELLQRYLSSEVEAPTDFYEAGDRLHPASYFSEALAQGGEPDRALEIAGEIRPWANYKLCRTDALAQRVRVERLLRSKAAASGYLLHQDVKSGGFWFASRDGVVPPVLSAHATMFAIQAMVMEQPTARCGVEELEIV